MKAFSVFFFIDKLDFTNFVRNVSGFQPATFLPLSLFFFFFNYLFNLMYSDANSILLIISFIIIIIMIIVVICEF